MNPARMYPHDSTNNIPQLPRRMNWAPFNYFGCNFFRFFLLAKSINYVCKVTFPKTIHYIRSRKISKAEWDTLLFFFGVILSVGGLGFIGYLTLVSEFLYDGLGPTIANAIVGILSAIVDNIPVMFAVITMRPEMSIDQWLLVTLTTGVGGSLLSIGSAAGVALMGQARGYYTFFGHLKWTPVIFLGYIASIYVHMILAGLSL